jgi:4-hydroxybenzoate polyprenyltransferase
MLYETLMRLVIQAPLQLWRLPLWLLAGKATLKREIASRVRYDSTILPVNDELLEWLRHEHARGRPLALVSAADEQLVTRIASDIGLFGTVIGSDGRTNLSGTRKLAAIQSEVGPVFDYAGDSLQDLPLFAKARASVLVGDVARLEARLPPEANVVRRFPAPGARFSTWMRAFRVHQWAKNLLVFLPVFLAGPNAGMAHWLGAAIAFLMLCCFASGGYVFNDLLDLEADRKHSSKFRRPFASGRLRIRDGIASALSLVAVGLTAGLALAPAAFFLGLAYLLGSVSYSLSLKRKPILDVLVLAGLFTLRIFTGVVAADVKLSLWLLTFSMFFFLNLALVKRYTELIEAITGDKGNLVHRGYTREDAPLLLAMGAGAVMAAAGIFVSYLMNEQFPVQIYSNPAYLWLIFPLLLFWMMRIWHLTVHGKMDADPVLFSLKDRASQGMGLLVLLCVWLAW